MPLLRTTLNSTAFHVAKAELEIKRALAIVKADTSPDSSYEIQEKFRGVLLEMLSLRQAIGHD